MRPFTMAFILTAIPLVALSLVSTAGHLVEVLYFVWLIALIIWVLAFLYAIVLFFTGEHEKGSGVFAGFAVGFLALAATCYANLAS